MTFAQFVERLKAVALSQPSVRTVVENDVFRLNALPSVEYGVFAFTQGQHNANLDTAVTTYTMTLFYVDRLTEDAGNEVEVQSVGMDTLRNIIATLADDFGITAWTINTFNQRFTDLCAGVFATVAVSIPFDYTCADDYAGDD